MTENTSDRSPVHITLDPPYRLDAGQEKHRFIGWCEIADAENPALSITINGVEVPFIYKPRPDVRAAFPDLNTVGFAVQQDLAVVLKDTSTMQDSGGFMLTVRVRADHRERAFEYSVTPSWLEAVFGRPLRPYPIPPAHLQIRVAGAAAGAFVETGRAVAGQIERILEVGGQTFPERGRVYDFGAGPGRVLAAMAGRHPSATYWASDIDPEAMAWCASEMADFGTFFTNQHSPPLPFEDRYLDLIYSISIFTHLPEDMQHAWLDELRRVLRPGGLLLTTKMNPIAYDLPESVKEAAAASGFAYFGDAKAVDGLPAFYRLAYHTDEYIRDVWGRYFEVLHIGSNDLNDTQDAVLLRAR